MDCQQHRKYSRLVTKMIAATSHPLILHVYRAYPQNKSRVCARSISYGRQPSVTSCDPHTPIGWPWPDALRLPRPSRSVPMVDMVALGKTTDSVGPTMCNSIEERARTSAVLVTMSLERSCVVVGCPLWPDVQTSGRRYGSNISIRVCCKVWAMVLAIVARHFPLNSPQT